MKYLLIILPLFLSLRLNAQVVYYDKGKKSNSTEVMDLYHGAMKVLDSTKQRGFNIEQLEILEIDEEKYLIPNGLSYVYHWKNGRWNNLYKGCHHGFNYGCKIFVHDGEIYAFGGYGFWRRHGMLVKFLMDRAEWELMPYTADLEFFYGWETETGLHAFNNAKTIEIDIDHQKVIEQKPLINNEIAMPLPLHWHTLEFDNYYYVIEQMPFIIDKKTEQIYITKQLPFNGFSHSSNTLTHIYGDSLTYFKNSLSEKHTVAVKNELQYFKPFNIAVESNNNLYLMLAGGLVITSAIGLFYIKRKRIVKVDDVPYIWNNKTLEQLLLRKGETLTVETLDTIFEINEIVPAETQRFKRSSIIKEVNRLYRTRYDSDLIIRRPDPEDGRRFVYVIG